MAQFPERIGAALTNVFRGISSFEIFKKVLEKTFAMNELKSANKSECRKINDPRVLHLFWATFYFDLPPYHAITSPATQQPSKESICDNVDVAMRRYPRP